MIMLKPGSRGTHGRERSQTPEQVYLRIDSDDLGRAPLHWAAQRVPCPDSPPLTAKMPQLPLPTPRPARHHLPFSWELGQAPQVSSTCPYILPQPGVPSPRPLTAPASNLVLLVLHILHWFSLVISVLLVFQFLNITNFNYPKISILQSPERGKDPLRIHTNVEKLRRIQ